MLRLVFCPAFWRSLLTAIDASYSAESQVPTQPVMTLLPPGVLAQNTQGQAVMITNVTVGTPYVDPGVSAYDTIDGDISTQVRSRRL